MVIFLWQLMMVVDGSINQLSFRLDKCLIFRDKLFSSIKINFLLSYPKKLNQYLKIRGKAKCCNGLKNELIPIPRKT